MHQAIDKDKGRQLTLMSACRWLQKDHLGVVVALFGTYVSFIAEAFGCAPQWCALHLTATVCLFSGILLFSAQFNSDSETRVKLHLFIYLAIYPAVFVTHWVWMRGGVHDDMVWVSAVSPLLYLYF